MSVRVNLVLAAVPLAVDLFDRPCDDQRRPSRVTIRVPGGQVGDIVQSSSVGPQFEVGEEVLVFLEFGEEDTARVVGGFQGKLTLSEHKVAGSDVSLDSFLSQVRQTMRDARISEGACEGD